MVNQPGCHESSSPAALAVLQRGVSMRWSHQLHLWTGRLMDGWTDETYCWWKNSCTSSYVVYLMYRILYIPRGAGFLPSTVLPSLVAIWGRSWLRTQPQNGNITNCNGIRCFFCVRFSLADTKWLSPSYMCIGFSNFGSQVELSKSKSARSDPGVEGKWQF